MKMFVAGIAMGLVAGVAAVALAQGAAGVPPGELPIVRPPITPAAGSLQTTRINDAQFVVVKDMGDQQIVSLFSIEGGLVKKQHAGKFLY